MTDTERPIPKDKITLCLDGTPDQVREIYRETIREVRNWCKDGGGIVVDISDIVEQGDEVYTTRAGGALNVELVYKERSLTFLIQGRNLYVRGWSGQGKVFELNFGTEKIFTLDRRVIKLRVGVNYSKLVNEGVKGVPTGYYNLTDAFDIIWKHAAGEKVDISEAVAIIAVHISEASRFPYICRYICKSFTDLELSKLGNDPLNPTYVTNFKRISRTIMQNIDLMKSGLKPVPSDVSGLETKTMAELIKDVGILYRDALNEEGSVFEHEAPPEDDPTENTMANLKDGRKKRESYQDLNKQKRPKGGKGPKGGGGGSIGAGTALTGVGSIGAGRGHGGRPAPFDSTGGPKEGLRRRPSSFYPNAPGLKVLLEYVPSSFSVETKRGSKTVDVCSKGVGSIGAGRVHDGPPASFDSTGGPKEGVGRCPYLFNLSAPRLKVLLQDYVPSCFSVHTEMYSKTVDVFPSAHPSSSQTVICYGDLSKHTSAFGKLWTPPTPAHSKKRCLPSIFSDMYPPSSLLGHTQREMRSMPPRSQVISGLMPAHNLRSAISGNLKLQFLSRTLRLIH